MSKKKIPYVKLAPNQRGIYIDKLQDKGDRYTITNYDIERDVACDLGISGAFILWRYLSHNKEDYVFGLSSAHLQDWGIKSRNGYTNAFETLVNKGYLVREPDDKREVYRFYQHPIYF